MTWSYCSFVKPDHVSNIPVAIAFLLSNRPLVGFFPNTPEMNRGAIARPPLKMISSGLALDCVLLQRPALATSPDRSTEWRLKKRCFLPCMCLLLGRCQKAAWLPDP